MAEVKIDTSSIKPNSHRYKDEQAQNADSDREKLAPVVKKEAVVSTKKPLSQKFAETFMSEDTDDIKSYILCDVIIPGIKNTVLDVMEMAFFGTSSGRGGRKRKKDYTDYRSSYGESSRSSRRERRERDRDRDRRRRDDRLDYRNVVLLDRSDAEDVIRNLHDRIRRYGSACIAELFDLIDEPPHANDENWGWTDERDIRLRRVSRGYLIDVTEAEYLD